MRLDLRQMMLAALLCLPAPAQYAGIERGKALLAAAKFGDTKAARRLLQTPAHLNLRDLRGLSAVDWAAANGNQDLAQALVSAGARVTGNTVDLAKANGFQQLAQWLAAQLRPPVSLRRKEATAALAKAAAKGDLKALSKALRDGAEVNAKGADGLTPLMQTVRGGHIEAALLLVDRGADPGSLSPPVPAAVAAGLARMNPPAVTVSKESLLTIRKDAARIVAAAQDARLKDAAARAEKAVNRLWERWAFTTPEVETGSAEYVASVRGIEEALARTAQYPTPDSAALIEDVAADLELKLAHCIATGQPLGGAVRVRVRTLRGAEEVTAWQVLFAPKIFESALDQAADVFPRFSSPTEVEAPPGRYLLWARNPQTGAVAGKTTVKIGGAKGVFEIDLPVP